MDNQSRSVGSGAPEGAEFPFFGDALAARKSRLDDLAASALGPIEIPEARGPEYDEANWPTSPRVMARDVLPETFEQIGFRPDRGDPRFEEEMLELAEILMSSGDRHALATALGDLMMQAQASGTGLQVRLSDVVRRGRMGRSMSEGRWE